MRCIGWYSLAGVVGVVTPNTNRRVPAFFITILSHDDLTESTGERPGGQWDERARQSSDDEGRNTTEAVALGFMDSLEHAYTHIARHPATESPRYAHELNLHGLRTWPLTRYPYLVFYVERFDHIDVWRVLHGQRDIPAWMQELDGV